MCVCVCVCVCVCDYFTPCELITTALIGCFPFESE